jgi:hypothetical protein
MRIFKHPANRPASLSSDFHFQGPLKESIIGLCNLSATLCRCFTNILYRVEITKFIQKLEKMCGTGRRLRRKTGVTIIL